MVPVLHAGKQTGDALGPRSHSEYFVEELGLQPCSIRWAVRVRFPLNHAGGSKDPGTLGGGEVLIFNVGKEAPL